MSRVWIENRVDNEKIDKLSKECGLNRILSKLLIARGIESKIEVDKFLNPSIKNICNPFKLKDVDKAIARLEKAKEKNKVIYIYGDYDCDGVTSTSTLMLGLKRLGFNVKYYIPSRDEGYGLNKNAIYEISKSSKVIVTVDCGITSFEEIEYAKSLGVDVIVTDHHEIKGDIPKAYAVINPKREDNIYKFKNLAGVGTAFMLLYGIYIVEHANMDYLFDLLEIVAIGTLADMVPLVSENRIFVKSGLERLNKSNRLPIRIIKEKLFPNREIKAIDISFRIAPLFNAAGRIADASSVVEFLISKDAFKAEEMFEHLFSLNRDRQNLGKDILIEAESLVDKEAAIIVVASRSFHQGLIGIIASKLVDKYKVPAVVLKIREDNTAVGSARSYGNLNLVETLTECKDLFVKFGGHAKAAGLTIEIEKIGLFKKKIDEIVRRSMKEKVEIIEIAHNLQDFDISVEFCKVIDKLKPFGEGNPEPIFMLQDIQFKGPRTIGKDSTHLMMDIQGRELIRGAVWFSGAKNIKIIDLGKRYDIAFKMSENYYNSIISPKIYLEDVRVSENKKCIVGYYRDLSEQKFPIKSVALSRVELPLGRGEYVNNNFYIKNNEIKLTSQLEILLNQLKRNYFYNFKIEVISSFRMEDQYASEILIDKSYSIDSSVSMKEQMIEIKKILIGNFEYNEMQKRVLRKMLIDKKSVDLYSQRGRGIKTLATAVAMYVYAKSGRKSLFVTEREDIDIPEIFEISKRDDIGYPFRYIDNTEHKREGFYLNFYDKYRKVEDAIEDRVEINKNLKIVSKRERKKAYNRGMKIEHKKIMIDRLNSNEEVIAERDFLVFL